MKQAIELHDSSIESIHLFENNIIIHFKDAYIHQSEGVPGVDVGKGGWQEANLILEDATLKTPIQTELPEEINEGSIQLEDLLHKNILPIPLHFTGEVVFYFRLNETWEDVTITANSAELELIGKPNIFEDFFLPGNKITSPPPPQ